MFVIWTRFVTVNGAVVRHVYGPYASRGRAQTALRRMRRDFVETHGESALRRAETQVTKMVDPEEG